MSGHKGRSRTLSPRAEESARARARARSEQRAVQVVEVGLSDLAVAVRRIVLDRSGRVTKREIADSLGITVTEVARLLVEIRSIAPIEKPQYLEQREIESALVFWEELEGLVFHDLQENEALSQAWAHNPIIVTLHSARIGLLNQLQLVRTNRVKFLQDVGLLRREAMKLDVNVKALESLEGEALQREIEDIDRRIREIEENGADANIYCSGTGEAETEALPRDAEDGDHLQG